MIAGAQIQAPPFQIVLCAPESRLGDGEIATGPIAASIEVDTGGPRERAKITMVFGRSN
jgi:hypothetical protein